MFYFRLSNFPSAKLMNCDVCSSRDQTPITQSTTAQCHKTRESHTFTFSMWPSGGLCLIGIVNYVINKFRCIYGTELYCRTPLGCQCVRASEELMKWVLQLLMQWLNVSQTSIVNLSQCKLLVFIFATEIANSIETFQINIYLMKCFT